jgi:Transposase
MGDARVWSPRRIPRRIPRRHLDDAPRRHEVMAGLVFLRGTSGSDAVRCPAAEGSAHHSERHSAPSRNDVRPVADARSRGPGRSPRVLRLFRIRKRVASSRTTSGSGSGRGRRESRNDPSRPGPAVCRPADAAHPRGPAHRPADPAATRPVRPRRPRRGAGHPGHLPADDRRLPRTRPRPGASQDAGRHRRPRPRVPAALPELRRLGRTLKKRAGDMLAYFDRPGTSNGPTEAINGRLEHLRGSALGFRNLTNYVARPYSRPAASDPTPPSIVKSPQTTVCSVRTGSARTVRECLSHRHPRWSRIGRPGDS